MANKPKSPDRPWIVKRDYNAVQGQGRKVVCKFYQTQQWKKLSTAWKHEYPMCIECERMGLLNRGNVVDHIKPINRKNPWDLQGGKFGHPVSRENLQTLCTFHHNQKSGRERWLT